MIPQNPDLNRNMNLVRDILIAFEGGISKWQIEGRKLNERYNLEDGVLGYHLWLLVDAGLLFSPSVNDGHMSSGQYYPTAFAFALTWEGHEYLDTIRNQNVWKKIESSLLKNGSGLSFEILKQLGVLYTKQQLGLIDSDS